MASVAFTEFLPDVLLEATGVPDPVAIAAVRNACFDFCKASLLWNDVQDPEAYTAGVAEYQITPPSGAQIVAVRHINLDENNVVYPVSLDDLVAAKPSWASAQGRIVTYVQPSPDTVRFVSVPDVGGTFVANAAYAPTRSATAVDSRIYNQYLEVIKYGALWKLKSMAGQPWADPTGAATYESRFLMGINDATIERQRSNSAAVLRVTTRGLA